MAFRSKLNKLAGSTGYMYEGREIVLARTPGNRVKKPRHSDKWWPDVKKIEVATLYAVLRDSEKINQLTDVPVKVIDSWINEPWFGEIVLKVRKERNEKLDAAITEVLAKGLEIVQDRFENGELMVNRRTGEEYRVPVNVKNVAIVADVFFDKRQLIRGEATTRTETITQEQKLEKLKNNFEKLARSKLINPSVPVIEGEVHELPEAENQAKAQETQGSRDSLNDIPPWEDVVVPWTVTKENALVWDDGVTKADLKESLAGQSFDEFKTKLNGKLEDVVKSVLPKELPKGVPDGVSGTEASESLAEPSTPSVTR